MPVQRCGDAPGPPHRGRPARGAPERRPEPPEGAGRSPPPAAGDEEPSAIFPRPPKHGGAGRTRRGSEGGAAAASRPAGPGELRPRPQPRPGPRSPIPGEHKQLPGPARAPLRTHPRTASPRPAAAAAAARSPPGRCLMPGGRRGTVSCQAAALRGRLRFPRFPLGCAAAGSGRANPAPLPALRVPALSASLSLGRFSCVTSCCPAAAAAALPGLGLGLGRGLRAPLRPVRAPGARGGGGRTRARGSAGRGWRGRAGRRELRAQGSAVRGRQRGGRRQWRRLLALPAAAAQPRLAGPRGQDGGAGSAFRTRPSAAAVRPPERGGDALPVCPPGAAAPGRPPLGSPGQRAQLRAWQSSGTRRSRLMGGSQGVLRRACSWSP
ncbi:uncharacterized protein LOC143692101 [Agelaius phoeniceus]|uniref:uncharacterized protein LOC143692101 n=1 Tax=Agelaius phoeniceus TaxID=39638 RepID=UPI0040550198